MFRPAYLNRRLLYLLLLPALLLAAGVATVTVGSADSDEILWIRQFGTEDSDFAAGVLADSVGNVYVVGRTGAAFSGQTKVDPIIKTARGLN